MKRRSSSTVIRVKDSETIVIGGLISRDRKNTEYKFPFLHKLPVVGEKLFTSKDVLEKKMDLIIQITPSVVRGEVAGITKTKAMFDIERSVSEDNEKDDTEEDNIEIQEEGDENDK